MEIFSDHGLLLRWIHLVAGVTWIGLLWFFNYVNGPFSASLEPAVRSKVVPQLMPRALWWFRWGAAVTWISGVVYAFLIAKSDPAGGHAFFTDTLRGQWILMGGLYGTIMAFNVWFMIWPRQRKIIGATIKGIDPPEKAQWVKVATNCSRINTYLSIPLLFAMGAAKHAGELGGEGTTSFMTSAALVTAVGFVVAWLFIHKVGPKVGKNFQG